MTNGVMSGEFTYFREIIGSGNILGYRQKRWICIHIFLLAKGDNPLCFSFHPWQIKTTFIELRLMQ
jgi:hypothetical protein